MTDATPTPYVTPWVDGTRASRSSAAFRTLGALTRVVDFSSLSGPLAARPLGSIEHVLVAPDGLHVAVRGAAAVWIFERDGKHVGSVVGNTWAGQTFLTQSGVFHSFHSYDWTGKSGPFFLYIPSADPARIWATHIIGKEVFFINQEPLLGNHESRQSERVEVIGNHLILGAIDEIYLGGDLMESTWGMGAIARDGQIAVMTTAGKLRVYAPRVQPPSKLERSFSGTASFAPYEMSVVEESIAALESNGVPPVDDTHDLGPYQVAKDLFIRFPEMKVRWKTTLHVLSMHGTEQSHVTVPFEVLQPPIDGGAGRIYLAGTGFAAVQDGHVVWSQPRSALSLATTFSGGEVAITVGRELRILDRDGNVRRSFATPDEPIVTPPSIAGDGAIWFATSKALYVVK